MNIEEKIKLVEDQLRKQHHVSEDFLEIFVKGMRHVYQLEKENIENGEKWRELENEVSAYYISDYDDNDLDIHIDDDEVGLDTIGEICARKLGFI